MIPAISVDWLESCESTSKWLKESTVADFKQPRAVASRIQTGGVGRMGRAWESLEGNLHFSIALPASCIPDHARSLLPFVVAVLVARWIEERSYVRVCLKWPNDILLDGRKVGGILCEATVQGSEFLGVVIGIGLNLKSAPNRTMDDGYSAGSILGLTGWSIAPRAAADSLARFFVDHFESITRSVILEAWQSYSIQNGHAWKQGAGSHALLACNEGLSSDGGLQLNPFQKHSSSSIAQSVVLSSVTNEFHWGLMRDSRCFVADVGNTRTKIACIDIDDQGNWRISTPILSESLESFISRKAGEGVIPLIHVVSVSPKGYEEFCELCKSANVLVRLLQKTPVRLCKSKYDFQMIGADRWAVLEALYYQHVRGLVSWPAMCVSLGTATTVDFVNGAGLHLGGYILAGLQTSLDAMGLKGANLPKALDVIHLNGSVVKWPENTNDAMTRATVLATLSFLKEQRLQLASDCGVDAQSIPVLLTGGYANVIQNIWNDPMVQTDEHLVLKGAAVLAWNGR